MCSYIVMKAPLRDSSAKGATGWMSVDTANVYNAGASEIVVGKALAGRREHVILATKAHFKVHPEDGPNHLGASRLNITLRLTFEGMSWQMASGAWVFTSSLSESARNKAKLKSTLPAANAMTPVDTFLMIEYSIPSRYGCPFFQ